MGSKERKYKTWSSLKSDFLSAALRLAWVEAAEVQLSALDRVGLLCYFEK